MNRLTLRRRVTLALISALLATALPISTPVSADGGAPTALTPARFMDTRFDGTTIDDRYVGWDKLLPGMTHPLQIAGRGDVPTDATAAFLNVTAVDPEADGYLTIFPCGADVPNASNVNYLAGQTIPNAAFVKLSGDGDVCIATHAITHVVIDVTGFVSPQNTPVAVEPARLADTRSDGSTVDGAGQRTGIVTPASPLVVPVAGRAGVPGTTSAAFLNVAAVDPTNAGYLTVYPCGGDAPNASNVNYFAGQTRAGAAFTKLDGQGRACIATLVPTHVVVDVAGHVPAGDAPVGFAPERMLDTRVDGATIDGDHRATGRVAGGDSYRLPVAGRGSVPATAGAVIANVTAVDPSADGFLTAYPCDADAPNASNVNYRAGITTANSAFVRVSLDGDGALCIRTRVDTDIVVDVAAYVELPGSEDGSPLNENAQPVPQQIEGIDAAVDVAVGTDFACAALESGKAQCWGEGFYGSLGNDSQDPAPGNAPAEVAGLEGVTSIDAGDRAACAIDAGDVYCWGEWDGIWGYKYGSAAPVQVTDLTGPLDVQVGGSHACALMNDGTVRCWGDNYFSAVNPQVSSNRVFDDPVGVPGISNATAISVSALSTCALLNTGAVKCWGAYDGMVNVAPAGSTSAIGPNSAGHCLLQPDGESGCWRADREDTEWTDAPAVPLSTSFAEGHSVVTGGSAHVCGLAGSGDVRCAGDNFDGATGHPTALWVERPHQVSNLSDVTTIDGEWISYCALTAGGDVSCWGADYYVLGNLPDS